MAGHDEWSIETTKKKKGNNVSAVKLTVKNTLVSDGMFLDVCPNLGERGMTHFPNARGLHIEG